MEEKKIRLGIIGCGGMSRAHVEGLNKISDNVEVTAVCDIIIDRAKVAAEGSTAQLVTTDYTEMVDYVDAVLVILPHDLHYNCGMFFARHKKHLLMEKPLCNTEEECKKLIDFCDEQGVVLMCAYPVRYWHGILELKRIVDSGEYGEPVQMSIWTEQHTNMGEDSWAASNSRLGGGQLFSHGCHYIDLLLWFMGNPTKGIHIGTNFGTPWMLGEGTSNVTIEFEGGKLGYHFGTWGAKGRRHGYSFQFLMTSGAMIEYKRSLGTIVVADENGERELYRTEGTSKNTELETLHFLDCIRTGKMPLTSGRESIKSLQAIWRMYDAEKHNVIADLTGLGYEKSNS